MIFNSSSVVGAGRGVGVNVGVTVGGTRVAVGGTGAAVGGTGVGVADVHALVVNTSKIATKIRSFISSPFVEIITAGFSGNIT